MEGADTPLIQNRVRELRGEIQPYAKGKKSSGGITFSSDKLYYIFPVLILIILIFWRPNFLYDEDGDAEGNVIRKFSYKKLLMYWLIASLIVVIGMFAYNYKKKRSSE
uniref:Uncharacterized protein n=1 Tax=viral metagenome TaxID=1070528 RepID=A0A6C0EK17_9ZZZZ